MLYKNIFYYLHRVKKYDIQTTYEIGYSYEQFEIHMNNGTILRDTADNLIVYFENNERKKKIKNLLDG